MINHKHVTFKTIDAAVQDLKSGEDRNTMDVCEITYPDGKVVAFPANDVSPEDGRKYSEIYAGKYLAFKNGDPDPDHVDRLNREIFERQAELERLRGGPTLGTSSRGPDDKRVQDNLGYGKVGDGANPQQAKAGQETRDKHEKPAKHKARA